MLLKSHLTAQANLKIRRANPDDAFVCKHGEAAIVEWEGHGQELGDISGKIRSLQKNKSVERLSTRIQLETLLHDSHWKQNIF